MELSAPTAALVLINGAALLLLNAFLVLPKIRPFLAGTLDDVASSEHQPQAT